MIKEIGTLIWESSPEGGVIVFAALILIIIWIIFYRKRKV
jgi:hypothetical protein